MFCDIFAGVQLLNLALQKSGESLVLADIPVYLDKTMSFFGKVKVCKQKTILHKTKFQQTVWFFQRSNGIFSTKFLHSVKPAIIWMGTIWNKCPHAIPWCIYERSWGSIWGSLCWAFIFQDELRKTNLRNHPGETTLDSLLQISTESPTGFDDDEYKYFVVELKLKWGYAQMRIKL